MFLNIRLKMELKQVCTKNKHKMRSISIEQKLDGISNHLPPLISYRALCPKYELFLS
jgi:hypothetical protein